VFKFNAFSSKDGIIEIEVLDTETKENCSICFTAEELLKAKENFTHSTSEQIFDSSEIDVNY
jgi:hypothetical protein